MKYIRLDSEDNRVLEIIPEYDSVFPDTPISQRYTAEFIASLMSVSDDTVVEQNWYYDSYTETFGETAMERDPMEELATKGDVQAVYDALAAAFTEGVNSIDE